jgi:hypothetical protein
LYNQIIDTPVLQAVVNFLQTLPHKDVHLLLQEVIKSTYPHPDNTPPEAATPVVDAELVASPDALPDTQATS